ncbi:MAG: DUF4350 domain-containing protein [Candidatus Sifarchaeia archaeon]|jgi:hypothetical protein
MRFIKTLKRCIAFLVTFCLIFVLIAGLPITGNDNCVTAIDQPLMRIVFDNTHEEANSITGEYNNAAELLNNKGYLINKSTEIHTDLSVVLLNCDVFVVTAPHKTFLPNETQLIETFVANGGNLFLLGDYEFNSTLTASINSLSSHFGIEFDQELIEDLSNNDGRPDRPTISRFNTHPIINTTDIQNFTLYNATSISGGRSIAFTSLEASPSNATVLTSSRLKSGKIVAIGDSDLFRNEFLEGDARNLLLNIFGWFVLDVNEIVVGVSSVVQGDSLVLIIDIVSLQNRSNLFIRVVGEGFEIFEEPFNITAGSNRISIEIQASLIPYTFGEKTIRLLILFKPIPFNRNIVYKEEFNITIRISTINLIIGYLIPFILILGLFLYSARIGKRKK